MTPEEKARRDEKEQRKTQKRRMKYKGTAPISSLFVFFIWMTFANILGQTIVQLA